MTRSSSTRPKSWWRRRTASSTRPSCRLCGGDVELAADLTQETYRKAWAAAKRFDGRGRVTTWLYRIAYNAFLNHRRRHGRVLPLDETAQDVFEAPEPSPEQFDASPRGGGPAEAGRARPPGSAAVRRHGEVLGRARVREIAAEEGITEVAVRKRLKRAMASMRGVLEGNEP